MMIPAIPSAISLSKYICAGRVLQSEDWNLCYATIAPKPDSMSPRVAEGVNLFSRKDQQKRMNNKSVGIHLKASYSAPVIYLGAVLQLVLADLAWHCVTGFLACTCGSTGCLLFRSAAKHSETEL